MNRHALAAVVFALAGISCGTDSAESSSDDLVSKPKGALSLAPKLAFDTKVSSALVDKELNLYDISLKAGDQIRVDKVVTSGDMSPDFTLYLGGTTTVKSKSFKRTATTLSKTYAATASGHYIVAVRAKDGKGGYGITLTCTGGPCAGGTTKPISGSVGALEDIFEAGQHDSADVESSEPIKMVEEYIAIEQPESAASYGFVENASQLEADVLLAGTLTVKAAKEAILDGIEHTYTFEFPEREAEIPALKEKAAAVVQDLVDAGASFGFDGGEQSMCAAPTAKLLVLDSTKSTVYGIELTPCVD